MQPEGLSGYKSYDVYQWLLVVAKQKQEAQYHKHQYTSGNLVHFVQLLILVSTEGAGGGGVGGSVVYKCSEEIASK